MKTSTLIVLGLTASLLGCSSDDDPNNDQTNTPSTETGVFLDSA